MKKILLPTLIFSLSCLANQPELATDAPKGRLVELHSCEVYAGACMVSSESTLGGRHLLQAWDITEGSWQGVSLAGLKAVVLETGTENLAEADANPENTVIYLPEHANANQQKALLSWLKSKNAKLASSTVQTRAVPINIKTTAEGVTVTAGEFASMTAIAMAECQNRVCGESLWYEPSTPTSVFTVARNGGSSVNEPLLQLKWSDHGHRSAFVAAFGEPTNTKNAYVQSSDWCGTTRRLF